MVVVVVVLPLMLLVAVKALPAGPPTRVVKLCAPLPGGPKGAQDPADIAN